MILRIFYAKKMVVIRFSSFNVFIFRSSSSEYQSYCLLQLTSANDQLITENNINHGILINLGNIDSMSGFDWNAKTNALTIKENGVYFFMVVCQVGARESTAHIVKGGDIRVWYELNGTPMTNSGSWVFAPPTGKANTIVGQMLNPFKAGDVITLKFSSSAPGMGLLAIPASEYWPASPSITLTAYKLN